MKKLATPYLLKFALVATVLTIIFRYFLSYGIDSKSTIITVLSAILYFVCMFIAGLYFGKKDSDYLPIYDVGFRFHFTTYLVHNLISELWFILNLNSVYEKIWTVHLTAIFWGIGLLFHYLYFLKTRNRSINGLDKQDLFL
jgi:hypothetical protein